MQMKDTRTIAAPVPVVWAALQSPEVLKDAVSGCQELTGNPEDGFEATVVQKVGPVKATFKGVVSFADVVEGQSLTLVGEGKGGAAGFAKGEAHVTLEPVTLDSGAEGTVLSYDVDAKVGGKLAQLGSRIIDGFARKMADDFFDRFTDAVEGPKPEEADAEEAAAEDTPNKGWFRKLTGR
ncbi:carbon monoxide dehydrogenase [Pararhodobacter marinus]|uniref:Carbon monoxide dehydrogenase n=1 Tax=Pararhodobacter marinus TaxID=2184063 RepID=A0A2U2CJ13_9RHOB|nr:carbon monoxide dehydrogenase subunit G [Pararhodobacter marinus]PWE31856.1 carbon monoxide dehydrogenase [Pararhodobacter marinus]